MTSVLAVSEAQQRRAFFEKETEGARATSWPRRSRPCRPAASTSGALRAEPKAAAESYARLKAEITAAEVRTAGAARQRWPTAAPKCSSSWRPAERAARASWRAWSRPPTPTPGRTTVSKYREFKYRETLFELFARQYEMARVDESREGALIQVVDPATPPEHKSKPKRAFIAVAATLLSLLLMRLRAGARTSGAQAARAAAVAH